MKKSLFLMACLGACALVLAACGKGREEQFSAGKEMNVDEAKAYREKLLAENAAEEEPEPEVEKGGYLPDVCYYTETGSVWHTSTTCSYLKNADNILEGTPEGAELAGKARPCSRCASLYVGD